jgi:TRAP-type mannitol/chloroaromatic compound transport system permease small subunit
MEASMEVCLACSKLDVPHVKVRLQYTEATDPAAIMEYDTVEHALVGLLRAAYTMAEGGHYATWDFIYSLAAWRMMMPGFQNLPTPMPSRAH